jgi:hypothetical protein
MTKYYIYIRWHSGQRDCVEITKGATEYWETIKLDNMKGFKFVRLMTASNYWLLLNVDNISMAKVVIKQTNPLEDSAHYDNPLN